MFSKGTGAQNMASPASRKSKRKIIIAVLALVVIAIVLIPVALAGGFTVPLAKLTFDETTGSGSYGNVKLTVSTVTAYEYYFSIRTGGLVRTSDSNVSSSRGTTNITIAMTLTNPSNQTIDLGKTNINGGIGTRTHTVYLSIGQGVRASGVYKLDVTITARVSVLGIFEPEFSATFPSSWTM